MHLLLGAIAGDIIGSAHEFASTRTTDFPLFTSQSRFTDDSVMTIAVADTLMTPAGYADRLHHYGNRYPDLSYGDRFRQWLAQPQKQPYNSWGNGSAMRVSPVAWAFDELEAVLQEARRSAEVTHDHPEGIRGAQATACAIFLARQGLRKESIRKQVSLRFGYDLERTIESIRPGYSFNESCQETVPEAIIAFLDSEDYEHALRLAISLGGDADTLACITGSIAAACYGGVPEAIARSCMARLDDSLRLVVQRFDERYGRLQPS